MVILPMVFPAPNILKHSKFRTLIQYMKFIRKHFTFLRAYVFSENLVAVHFIIFVWTPCTSAMDPVGIPCGNVCNPVYC